jgi:hypothetical protein
MRMSEGEKRWEGGESRCGEKRGEVFRGCEDKVRKTKGKDARGEEVKS